MSEYSAEEKDRILFYLVEHDLSYDPKKDYRQPLIRLLTATGYVNTADGYGNNVNVSITDRGLIFVDSGGYKAQSEREERSYELVKLEEERIARKDAAEKLEKQREDRRKNLTLVFGAIGAISIVVTLIRQFITCDALTALFSRH